MATTSEVEVETQDGQREPPLKMSFPYAITFPNPGGGWKEGETIIALYASRLRAGHWRLDCCAKGRAGVPEGQLRRLAASAVTGVRGWGDRAEEHMSYAWFQMHTRAKVQHRRYLGEVGGVVDVDAEEGGGGGEEGGDGSSMRSSRSGGSRSRVGRPHKAPKLAAKPGGQPLAAKPVPAKQAAAQVDACVAAQAGAMPEWQKRAVAVEGDVLLLQGKLQEAEQRATAGPGPPPGAGPQTQAEGGRAGAAARRADGRGGGAGAVVGAGTTYLMAGSQAWKA